MSLYRDLGAAASDFLAARFNIQLGEDALSAARALLLYVEAGSQEVRCRGAQISVTHAVTVVIRLSTSTPSPLTNTHPTTSPSTRLHDELLVVWVLSQQVQGIAQGQAGGLVASQQEGEELAGGGGHWA
jgi:hypothetical protein